MEEKISTGSSDFNKFLRGGYEKDVVTVLYGGPGSGKTNFCLTAAVEQAKKGKRVIFIDTEGGFSVERVRQISEKDILEKIVLLKPTSFEEQKVAFRQLLRYLKKEVSLIVVDGMTILYRLDFADAREKGEESLQSINSGLAKMMKILAEIARKKKIPVIVTNQTYFWDGEERMVGGDILKYWGKCLIYLKRETFGRVAKLVKHRSLPEGSFSFQIYSGGIKKRGWL